MSKYDLEELRKMGIQGTASHVFSAVVATACAIIVCLAVFIIIISQI